MIEHKAGKASIQPVPDFVTFPYLEVSTCHVTLETMAFLKTQEGGGSAFPAVASDESGAWISLSSQSGIEVDVPADLRAILNLAQSDCASTVRIHKNGREYTGLKRYAAHALNSSDDSLPEGWTEAGCGGLATNPHPRTGGIIDRTIVDGKWFVVFHREDLDVLEGLPTRRSAFEAFNNAINPPDEVLKLPDAHAITVSVMAHELAGALLDWAVATCERLPIAHDPMGFKSGSEAGFWIWDKAPNGMLAKIGKGYTPSTDPSQAWPIIDRERPHLCPIMLNGEPAYEAWLDGKRDRRYYGETALIAAMRCYVASKLGEVVEVPSELAYEASMKHGTPQTVSPACSN